MLVVLLYCNAMASVRAVHCHFHQRLSVYRGSILLFSDVSMILLLWVMGMEIQYSVRPVVETTCLKRLCTLKVHL